MHRLRPAAAVSEPGPAAATEPVTLVRIAGLMRSGTNLLTWMLRQNFTGLRTATMLLGWKHGPIYRDRVALGPGEYVDPRYVGELQRFMREQPAAWAGLTGSGFYRDAVTAQRRQDFAVALAVRDPEDWYASCVRIATEAPAFLLHDTAPAVAAAFWNQCHARWLDTLGPRSVIVDTDALRREPEPSLARITSSLGLRRSAGVKLPVGYLHPRGTEEIYELLGTPVATQMEREFTRRDTVDAARRAAFRAGLDGGILRHLGLAAGGAD